MLVTELGITIEVRLLQNAKAFLSIDMMELDSEVLKHINEIPQ